MCMKKFKSSEYKMEYLQYVLKNGSLEVLRNTNTHTDIHFTNMS